ncbi:protein Flattop [Nematolebias whitei]|uniref:protein Flattop n=1 Tax=Nematolebias whitei TaxID=451745 RepID=UPI00189ACF4F|nr:protein Flattop [Nematolebias whitei]
MASSFSANQYDGAFKSQRLQNWCEAKHFKERPSAWVSPTSFIADNRGHLLPGVKKGNAWPDFKGTWDLPARVPAHHINPTARSAEGLGRLRSWGLCPQQSAKSLRGGRSAHVSEKTIEGDPAAPAKARTASQNHQNHRSQTGVAVSVEQNVQASEHRPKSQTSATEENPVSSPTAGKTSPNGPETQKG